MGLYIGEVLQVDALSLKLLELGSEPKGHNEIRG